MTTFWVSGGDGTTGPFFWVEEPVSAALATALDALSRWGSATKRCVPAAAPHGFGAGGWEARSEDVPTRSHTLWGTVTRASTTVSERQFRAVLALAGRVEVGEAPWPSVAASEVEVSYE